MSGKKFDLRGVKLKKGLLGLISRYMTFAPFLYSLHDGGHGVLLTKLFFFLGVISSKVNDHGFCVTLEASSDEINNRG